ncbi:MAG: RhuM family protein [Schleiferiaceae bacterium]|nr:RhuM family protein [Schleiferiaceae bacterium]MDR9442655.1 RhuM family protein [Schleiferiaceae bacterium]
MKELAVSEKWYSRNLEHDDLDLSQQVKSHHGTQFRIWANQVLKNYLLQGYTVSEAHKAPSGLVFKNNISA